MVEATGEQDHALSTESLPWFRDLQQVQTVLADIQFSRHLPLCFAAMDHQLHRLALEFLPYLRAILLFFTVVLILL
jgi:hypothetical protein